MADPGKTMSAPKRKPTRMAQAILETAAALHRIGAMDDDAYARITRRLGTPRGSKTRR